MVVLGPDLELIHAHPQTEDLENQKGIVSFGVNFPKPGTYVSFLQIQADNKVSTFDYAIDVKD